MAYILTFSEPVTGILAPAFLAWRYAQGMGTDRRTAPGELTDFISRAFHFLAAKGVVCQTLRMDRGDGQWTALARVAQARFQGDAAQEALAALDNLRRDKDGNALDRDAPMYQAALVLRGNLQGRCVEADGLYRDPSAEFIREYAGIDPAHWVEDAPSQVRELFTPTFVKVYGPLLLCLVDLLYVDYTNALKDLAALPAPAEYADVERVIHVNLALWLPVLRRRAPEVVGPSGHAAQVCDFFLAAAVPRARVCMKHLGSNAEQMAARFCVDDTADDKRQINACMRSFYWLHRSLDSEDEETTWCIIKGELRDAFAKRRRRTATEDDGDEGSFEDAGDDEEGGRGRHARSRRPRRGRHVRHSRARGRIEYDEDGDDNDNDEDDGDEDDRDDDEGDDGDDSDDDNSGDDNDSEGKGDVFAARANPGAFSSFLAYLEHLRGDHLARLWLLRFNQHDDNYNTSNNNAEAVNSVLKPTGQAPLILEFLATLTSAKDVKDVKEDIEIKSKKRKADDPVEKTNFLKKYVTKAS